MATMQNLTNRGNSFTYVNSLGGHIGIFQKLWGICCFTKDARKMQQSLRRPVLQILAFAYYI